jgi:serine/threonine-protein kinase
MDNAIQPPDPLSMPTVSDASDEVDWTGQVLGEFRLMHRLGRGGMGQVYLAEQTSLKRKVALKLLHPDLASNERSLQRFKAEAENVARATHANIVQIYTIGQANGINYLALEYVEGKNLRDFLEKKGTPELSLGLHIMLQVAAALQRASELGIIHRDIKPENILLTRKGEVKVADFGLSRCFAEDQAQSITQSQVTMGTPLYMSPEQVERKPVDTRTDIYSFGVTCYHVFAGTPPFRGNSPIDVAYQHVHSEAQPLAEIRPDLPAALCAIVHKMMAKKPEDRYQSAREIVRDVNQLREALNLGAVSAISISSSFIGVAPTDGLRGGATQPWQSAAPRPPWLLPALFAASVLLALGAGFGFRYWQHLQQATVDLPNSNEHPPVQPGVERKLSMSPEDEKTLIRQVYKYLEGTDTSDMQAGRKHALELTVYYLQERRLDDADKLFKLLNRPDRKLSYRFLGRIGHASVLAFKGESKESNAEFVSIIAEMEKKPAKEKQEAYRILWKEESAFALREQVAKALEHNFVNDPVNFPADKLDVYRFPPRPALKPAP